MRRQQRQQQRPLVCCVLRAALAASGTHKRMPARRSAPPRCCTCCCAACRLPPPLGLGSAASSSDVLRFVFDLDIPLLGGRVPFQRTAYELVRRCSGAEIPDGMLKDQVGGAA